MSDVVLRPMRRDDLDEIVALELELFGAQAWTPSMLADELADADSRWYLVAEVAGEIAGYAGLAAFGDEAHVMTVGTVPRLQGRGVGRSMLRALINEAERRSVERVILEVRVDNDAAIALYESEGFTTVGVRKGYYQPEGVDAAVMIRG